MVFVRLLLLNTHIACTVSLPIPFPVKASYDSSLYPSASKRLVATEVGGVWKSERISVEFVQLRARRPKALSAYALRRTYMRSACHADK